MLLLGVRAGRLLLGGVRLVDALDVNGEDGVRARRVRVHQRGACAPVVPAAFHQTRALGDAQHAVHRQARHVHS